jgi:hypothetical protein
MQLDLDRPLRPVSFLSCLCFVFLLVRHLSPLQASTGYHLFCVVQSKQAHLAMANLLQRESNMAPHSLLKQAGSLNVVLVANSDKTPDLIEYIDRCIRLYRPGGQPCR